MKVALLLGMISLLVLTLVVWFVVELVRGGTHYGRKIKYPPKEGKNDK